MDGTEGASEGRQERREGKQEMVETGSRGGGQRQKCEADQFSRTWHLKRV